LWSETAQPITLRNMNKSVLKVQELMKAIKKHKSEIEKEKMKNRQGIIYKMFFQFHIIFHVVS